MTKPRDPSRVPTQSRKRRAPVAAPMVVRDRDAAPSPEERARRIAEHAYLLAEQRGFGPGNELEDWLAAERAVDAELASRPS